MCILQGLRLVVKITSLILFISNVVVSFKEKREGNYLEALYSLGFAIISYVAAATT